MARNLSNEEILRRLSALEQTVTDLQNYLYAVPEPIEENFQGVVEQGEPVLTGLGGPGVLVDTPSVTLAEALDALDDEEFAAEAAALYAEPTTEENQKLVAEEDAPKPGDKIVFEGEVIGVVGEPKE